MTTMLQPHRPCAALATDLPRGELLRTYRELRGWSVEALAAGLNVTPSYVYMIETGSRNPRDIDLWTRAAALLHIPFSLLGRRRGGGAPPAGGDGTSLADEEEILAGCWELFYRAGVVAAAPMAHAALRRIARRQERAALTASWQTLLSRFHQLAGVLARDQDDMDAAVRHGRISVDMAEQAGQVDVHAAALLRIGRTLAAQDALGAAVARAREAVVLAPRCPPSLRGYLHQSYADLLAREGVEPRYVIERQLDRAEVALGHAGGGQADGSYTILSDSGIAHDWATALIRLRAPLADCLGRIAQARAALPASHLRWHTALRCSEALAYAVNGHAAETLSRIETAYPEAQGSPSHLKRLRAAYRLVAPTAPDAATARVGALLEV